MSGFECKYKNSDFCELRRLECAPGAKGCVLNKSGAKFIKPPWKIENGRKIKELDKK